MLISIALNTMSGKFALVMNTNTYVYIRMLCVNELCVCVCACMRACVRACMRVCVRVCVTVCLLYMQWESPSLTYKLQHMYMIYTHRNMSV